jgi:hypothetical protein
MYAQKLMMFSMSEKDFLILLTDKLNMHKPPSIHTSCEVIFPSGVYFEIESSLRVTVESGAHVLHKGYYSFAECA